MWVALLQVVGRPVHEVLAHLGQVPLSRRWYDGPPPSGDSIDSSAITSATDVPAAM